MFDVCCLNCEKYRRFMAGDLRTLTHVQSLIILKIDLFYCDYKVDVSGEAEQFLGYNDK